MNDDGVKILLVDDHQIMRQGLRLLVQREPNMIVVGEAASGRAAIDQVRTLKPQVLILDIHLPDISGIEIARQLITEFPELKIVALSSDAELQVIKEAFRAGVSGYVTKTCATDELVRAIRAVLDQRKYLCPDVATVMMPDYMQSTSEVAEAGKPVLTERERLVLKLVAEGKRSKEIAEALSVGPKSIETYRSRLMKKLNCDSAADLTRYAIREGIVRA